MLSRTIEKYDAIRDRIRLISISFRIVIFVPVAETYVVWLSYHGSLFVVVESEEEENVPPRCGCPNFSCRTP